MSSRAHHISTHVLDTHRGKPASDIGVTLESQAGDVWTAIGRGRTNTDGRVESLTGEAPLTATHYRLVFETGAYFKAQGVIPFFPRITISFEITDPKQHYHVPLLLNACGYTTYRGS